MKHIFKPEKSPAKHLIFSLIIGCFLAGCENVSWVDKPYRTGYPGQRIRYVNDTLNGVSLFFHDLPGMKIKERRYYLNGLQHGLAEQFNDQSRRLELAHYRHGELNGMKLQFNESGDTLAIEHFKAGLKHGNCTYFGTSGEKVVYKFCDGHLCSEVQ